MATTGFAWGAESGFDLHLLRGSSFPSLLDGLFVRNDTTWVPAAGPGLPPDLVGISFACDVQPAALVQQGIIIDAATGRIDVDALPPGPPVLRNFLVHARATHTNPALPSPLEADIRVHVHASVTEIWLTPAALTIHVGADGLKFTVLAEFDDGVAGDVTAWTNLTWSSSAPGDVQVDAGTGALKAITAGAGPTITVTLPASAPTPAMTASGVVHALPAWAAQDAEFVGGKGAAARGDVKNILFISDGFAVAEKAGFDELVQNLVQRLKHGMRPYDLLRNSVNYWQAFVASPESGVSILPESRTFTRAGTNLASIIPLASKPQVGATSWKLEELIYQVGLPVLADDPPTRPLDGAGGRLADWQALYGQGIARDLVKDAYAAWLAAATRTLPNERDTAFGVGVGTRPNLHPGNTTRNLGLNPRRTTPDQFTKSFVELLTFGGTAIGSMWTTGDSKGLVCLISRTLQDGGAQFGVGFATTLDEQAQFEVATAPAPRLGLDVLPADVAKANGWMLASTTAHECAHAFGLKDEYGSGGSKRYPSTEDDALKTVGNLEPVRGLDGGAGLDGTKIKWLWPRISHAGVLASPPSDQGGGIFRLVLQPGHGAPFKTGDIARLRLRPLPEYPELSTALEVTGVAGDEIQVRPDTVPAFVPGNWPAGSVLLVPVPDPDGPAGSFLPLVAPQVRDNVTATHKPLNGPPPTPGTECGDRSTFIQVPVNLPQGLTPPKTKAFIVGIYEGGGYYDADVFHPAGMCKMRSLSTSCVGLTRFCQVCRYLIVDAADPSRHGDLDAIYAKEYPH